MPLRLSHRAPGPINNLASRPERPSMIDSRAKLLPLPCLRRTESLLQNTTNFLLMKFLNLQLLGYSADIVENIDIFRVKENCVFCLCCFFMVKLQINLISWRKNCGKFSNYVHAISFFNYYYYYFDTMTLMSILKNFGHLHFLGVAISKYEIFSSRAMLKTRLE